MKLKSKKGILGLDYAKGFMLTMLTLAVIGFAAIIAMGTLSNSSILAAGSLAENQTTSILNNVSIGVGGFFTNVGTWFTLLSVVIIILIISVVIWAVGRFGGGQTAGI